MLFLDRIVIYLQLMHSKSFLLFWNILYVIIYTVPFIQHSVGFLSQIYYTVCWTNSFHQFALPHILTQASGHTLYNILSISSVSASTFHTDMRSFSLFSIWISLMKMCHKSSFRFKYSRQSIHFSVYFAIYWQIGYYIKSPHSFKHFILECFYII